MGTLIQQRLREMQAEQAGDFLKDGDKSSEDNYLSHMLAKATDTRPEYQYKVLKGENFWDVARRLKLSAPELAEHNDLPVDATLQAGQILHLYQPRAITVEEEIVYRLLPEPLEMHVVNKGGTKKWLFGNVKTLDGFRTHGFYPENTTITIVGTAEVPVKDDKGVTQQVGFYMDAVALGDFAVTGRVNLTSGFRWIDLKPGVFTPSATPVPAEPEPPVKAPAPTVDISPPKPAPVADIIVQKEAIAVKATENPEQYPNFFKTSYEPFNIPVLVTAALPPEVPFIMIEDFGGKRPPRRWSQNQEIDISGTFYVNGVLYGRPTQAAQNGFWFGIPMDSLIANTDLYNADIGVRVSEGGTLYFMERFITLPFAKMIYHPRFAQLRAWGLKNQSKNKKG